MRSVTFAGLHVVDITALTDHQKEIFWNKEQGSNTFRTQPKPIREKGKVTGYTEGKLRPIFTQKRNRDLKLPTGLTNGRLDVSEHDLKFYYSPLKVENTAHGKLNRLVSAFSNKFNRAIAYIYIPGISPQEIEDTHYKNDAKKLPGMLKALNKLGLLHPVQSFHGKF